MGQNRPLPRGPRGPTLGGPSQALNAGRDGKNTGSLRFVVRGWRLRVWSAVGGCGLCCGLKMLYASCTLTSFTVHTTAHTLLNARLTAAQAERRAAAAGVGRDVKILMTNTVFTATPGFGPSLLMMASITKAELPSEGVVTVHTSYCWVTKGTY